MMVGDAELPVIQVNVQLQNNRILNSMKYLISNETLPLRRRAAEIFSNSVAFASDIDLDLKMKIAEGIYEIMKKYDEDWIVLSHILTLLKNLGEKRSALIHLLLPMVCFARFFFAFPLFGAPALLTVIASRIN
uniref:Clathrin/coatomer adaptor adaptin-like N-terminal domain-containing protein n=1 Tax=Panagrolaimus davidi TaxID=227884 RepID=A0A914PCY6_9BILA